MALRFELDRFPIVVCRLSAHDVQELERDCDRFVHELSLRRGLFAGVHDWTLADALTTSAWHLAFDRVVRASAFHQRCVGQAVVVHTAAVRGFVTSFATRARAPYPIRVTASLGSGLSWAQSQLRRSDPAALAPDVSGQLATPSEPSGH